MPRVPPECDGLQINYCKNPRCSNFGVPVGQQSKYGRGQNPYRVVASAAGMPMGRCHGCGEHFPFKSNAGIVQERDRMRAYLTPKVVSCPVPSCANHSVPVGGGAYHAYGKTKGGSQRWRCGLCRKVFSVPAVATLRQRNTSRNGMIFRLLVNHTPLNRIAEVADVNIATVFHRLHFIHRQCLAFAADRERRLATMPIRRLYISVDRQEYLLNWQSRADKRNTVLAAVASVDNATGYCFGLHLNYDSSLVTDLIEFDAKAINDLALPTPHRKYARLWLTHDYDRAAARSKRRMALGAKMADEIDDAYAIAQTRDDIEAPDDPTASERLPVQGMQTHLEYTLYGHFLFLRSLVPDVGKWRFFLDQDSGIRAACLAAFTAEIKARTCDAFFVRINKTMTVDQKRRACRTANERFASEKEANPGLTDREVVILMFKQQIAAMVPHGTWKDRWLTHPQPTISEPELAISHLTDFGDYDPNHLAMLYAKASLHGVDSLFNWIRRRSTLLERSLHSQGNAGRIWTGYAPYRPEHAEAMLDILRVVHNFVHVSDIDKKTAAMRIGLAMRPISYEKIARFI